MVLAGAVPAGRLEPRNLVGAASAASVCGCVGPTPAKTGGRARPRGCSRSHGASAEPGFTLPGCGVRTSGRGPGLLQVRGDEVPVDQVPECLQVLRPRVAVVDVV